MARRDVIAIEGLVVDCVVGVYPHERDSVQPLRVDLYLELDTRMAAERERLRESVDYAAVAGQLSFLLGACRFGMIETAAHALARYLLLPPAPGERRAQIDALRLRLTKPSAVLAGQALPWLEITRDAAEFPLQTEQSKFGHVDVVFETRDAGIYRLNVAPGLLCQGQPVAPGTVFHWPLGAAHRYDNPTSRHQTILCVDSPRFMPEDEIEVDGEPADVKPGRAFAAHQVVAP